MKKIEVANFLKTTKKQLNYIVTCIMQVNAKTASDFIDRIGKAIASKTASTVVATGFLGLVSAFGTAGTGTTISSLSGAAATNATLAWVGGLVSGGMAAGTLLTGGLALIIGVATYKLLGSKPREYTELADTDQKIVDTCIVLIKAINEQASKEERLSKEELRSVYQHAIAPLYNLMKDNEKNICYRLSVKNSFLFSKFAIPNFKKNVVDVLSSSYKIKGTRT